MGRRVVVVDDDREIRDAVKERLTDEGYEVTVVPNGLRLLAALQIETGNAIPGPITAGLEVRYEKKNNERFFGYGNGDETKFLPGTPVDPNMDETAVETRYPGQTSSVMQQPPMM